jgi:hypothetical protein
MPAISIPSGAKESFAIDGGFLEKENAHRHKTGAESRFT